MSAPLITHLQLTRACNTTRRHCFVEDPAKACIGTDSLRIRKASTPEPEHKELYRLLHLPMDVMRPKKSWSKPSAGDEM